MINYSIFPRWSEWELGTELNVIYKSLQCTFFYLLNIERVLINWFCEFFIRVECWKFSIVEHFFFQLSKRESLWTCIMCNMLRTSFPYSQLNLYVDWFSRRKEEKIFTHTISAWIHLFFNIPEKRPTKNIQPEGSSLSLTWLTLASCWETNNVNTFDYMTRKFFQLPIRNELT